MRFGKHPAKNDFRTLRMANYLTASLPAPPDAFSSLDRVAQNLGNPSIESLFPMYANDRYGCCTIAALVHAATVWHGLAGTKYLTTDDKVLKLYMHLTGGVDSGLVELDVLNYWRQKIISQDQVLAFVKIDTANHDHVKQAIQLFGCVYLGFQCQAETGQQFQNREMWTPGTLTNEGHAVVATSWGQDGVSCLTWGGSQKGSWEWWDQGVDEAYAILSATMKQADFAHGFDFAALQADLAAVAL